MNYTVSLIQINVTDVAAAKEFYVDTLGFPMAEYGIQGVVTLLNGDGAPILLYPVEQRVEHDYPNQTGALLVFHVEDIDQTVEEWKSKGVEFIRISFSEEESGIAPCPFGRFIAFRDPFGNVHEILQPYSES